MKLINNVYTSKMCFQREVTNSLYEYISVAICRAGMWLGLGEPERKILHGALSNSDY